MGRSVEVPNDAVATFFHHWELDAEDYDIAGELFEDHLIEPVRDVLRATFPSFEAADESYHPHRGYRETRVILENGHAMVTVSEYCGLVAVALVPLEDPYPGPGENELHAAWAARVAERFENVLAKAFGGRLRCLGRASNGEAFFEHTPA